MLDVRFGGVLCLLYARFRRSFFAGSMRQLILPQISVLVNSKKLGSHTELGGAELYDIYDTHFTY